MSDPHIRAAFYLSPTLDALWRWSDDGEVLTWPDDTTIAFRPEVEAVLQRLASGGLPPFGAVALVLAACREGWYESKGRDTIVGYAGTFWGINPSAEAHNVPFPGASLAFGRVAHSMGRLLEGLDAVRRLPRELREGAAAKAVLAEVVIEASKNRGSPADAALVMQALEDGVGPETLRPQLSNQEALSQFARQVDGLSEGLARVDAEALARRAKTGLDEQVGAPDEDLSPPERVRRLLANLRDDPELAAMAKLAQDLMAAVSVPRTLRAREEPAVGGVSDLTNRGPLDRLLVSELAHDDLTLAVRVAVNEALYLRRESPPREPPHRRAILIDAGIRTWGVPRVFAAAVALALAATNDPKAELLAFRATQDGVTPVDLTTRRGLDAHLGALETAPYPGPSLEPFFEALKQGEAEQTDALLVTHADVLADPEFMSAVQALREPSMYVATVDRDGSFRLLALSRAGKKVIREARLSLDAVLGRTPTPTPSARRARPGVPLIAPERDPAVPAILYADPFPLMLPHVADPKSAATSNQIGLVAATPDGRLLHWPDGQHGARQLTSLLPHGQVRLITINDASRTATVVVTRRREMSAILVNADLTTGRCAVTPLDLCAADPVGVFAGAGLLYFAYRSHVDAFSSGGGPMLATANLPAGVAWRRERFFSTGREWFAVGYDGGTALKLERVPGDADTELLFDREGDEAPWAVLRNGSLLDPAGRRYSGFVGHPARLRHLGVSRDGHRLVAQGPKGGFLLNLKLARGEPRPFSGGQGGEALLEPQIHWSTRSHVAPRSKFRSIGVGVGARPALFLRTHHRRELILQLDKHGDLSLTELAGELSGVTFIREFTTVHRPAITRLALRVATWNDGSRAWLDPRGLLHLTSSDRSVPELTVALSTAPPAAWSSEGKVCGPAYFIGDAPATEGAYFMDLIRRFVARLR